ncbi:MAG TPA: licheninase, partial [Bifidobacterium dentium]|nr:licheninase [Bifidobacterium dentium]
CNDNMVATATNLHGPWSDFRPFTPEGSHTYQSQCDVIVPLDGDDQWHASRFLYVGDRWNPDDLGNSELVTLPIAIHERHAALTWHDSWDNGL